MPAILGKLMPGKENAPGVIQAFLKMK